MWTPVAPISDSQNSGGCMDQINGVLAYSTLLSQCGMKLVKSTGSYLYSGIMSPRRTYQLPVNGAATQTRQEIDNFQFYLS